ncbi:hypothetical protein J5N97_028290 [Dioscorea zingiberensis]|uniref:Uncharacterized protein n=1 Tax=Dioscorea zingiberensis TaxID=325984 RepID=A0A9D5H4N2_9LILI|nr:hypothetical protein J5N97_028290 [Dioscorea zingiberensis]
MRERQNVTPNQENVGSPVVHRPSSHAGSSGNRLSFSDTTLQLGKQLVDRFMRTLYLTNNSIDNNVKCSANKLFRLKEQTREYVALIMEELDPERLGYIELWQLETLLLQKDTYLNYSQTLSYTSQALSQNLPAFHRRGPIHKLGSKVHYFLEENWKRLWVLMLWVGAMAWLFLWKFMQYRNRLTDQGGACDVGRSGAGEHAAPIQRIRTGTLMTWKKTMFRWWHQALFGGSNIALH